MVTRVELALLLRANDASLALMLRFLVPAYHAKYRQLHASTMDNLTHQRPLTAPEVSGLVFGIADLIDQDMPHPAWGEWKWLYKHTNRWARQLRNLIAAPA